MQILMVEDNPMQRDAAKVLLKDDDLYFASNLAGALKSLESGNIGGVISDLIGTGGALTVLEIRAKFPAIPVVVLTGDGQAGDFSDPMVRVLVKGKNGPLEARAALAEMGAT